MVKKKPRKKNKSLVKMELLNKEDHKDSSNNRNRKWVVNLQDHKMDRTLILKWCKWCKCKWKWWTTHKWCKWCKCKIHKWWWCKCNNNREEEIEEIKIKIIDNVNGQEIRIIITATIEEWEMDVLFNKTIIATIDTEKNTTIIIIIIIIWDKTKEVITDNKTDINMFQNKGNSRNKVKEKINKTNNSYSNNSKNNNSNSNYSKINSNNNNNNCNKNNYHQSQKA